MTTKEHTQIVRTFDHKKETKGTHQYKEQPVDGITAIDTIYIKKPVIVGSRPDKITVTVEW